MVYRWRECLWSVQQAINPPVAQLMAAGRANRGGWHERMGFKNRPAATQASMYRGFSRLPGSPPQILETVRCKLGIAHRRLDAPVSKVTLQGPGIRALVCQYEATSMTQHMGMDRERQLSLYPCSFDQLGKAGSRERRAALTHEDKGRVGRPL